MGVEDCADVNDEGAYPDDCDGRDTHQNGHCTASVMAEPVK
jgi:hypothetical protein